MGEVVQRPESDPHKARNEPADGYHPPHSIPGKLASTGQRDREKDAADAGERIQRRDEDRLDQRMAGEFA